MKHTLLHERLEREGYTVSLIKNNGEFFAKVGQEIYVAQKGEDIYIAKTIGNLYQKTLGYGKS